MKAKSKKALWTFLGVNSILIGSLMLFVQSSYFAKLLTGIAKKYMPESLGLEATFSELSVKIFPPGIVIKSPSLDLKKKNIIGLPEGTTLSAQSIDVTLQWLQLLAGIVRINAFVVEGANFQVNLENDFFDTKQKLKPRKFDIFNSASDVLNFRSVTFSNSKVDIRIARNSWKGAVHVIADAKELTVSRSTVDRLPSFDLAIDFKDAEIEAPFINQKVSQKISRLQASAGVSIEGVQLRSFGLQTGNLSLHANGNVQGNLLDPQSLKSQMNYILKGDLSEWLKPEFFGRYYQVPKGKKLTGIIDLEGRLTADLLNFNKTVDTKAKLKFENLSFDGWLVRAASFIGRVSPKNIELASAELNIGSGLIRVGSTVYDLTASEQTLSPQLELTNVDIRTVLGPLVNKVYPLHLVATGKVQPQIFLGKTLKKDGKTVQKNWSIGGSFDLSVADFSLDNQKPKQKKPFHQIIAVKEVGVRGGFHLDSNQIKFDRVVANLPNTQLECNGNVNFNTGFNLDVQGNVDLKDIGKLAVFDIAGNGKLHWTITGKAPKIFLSFEPELENGMYLNMNLGNVKGKIVWDDNADTLRFYNVLAKQGRTPLTINGSVNLGKTEVIDLDVQVPKGSVQDFAKIFEKYLAAGVPWYPHELAGSIRGPIKVSGKTDLAELSAEGDFEIQNLTYKHEVFRSVRFHGGFRRGAFVAERVNALKKNGWVRGSVIYDASEILKFDFASQNFTTLDFDTLSLFEIPYRAPIEIELKGEGKIGNIKSRSRFHVGAGNIRGYHVGPSNFLISSGNGRLKIDSSVFSGQAKIALDYGWADGLSSSFQLKANQFDFKPLLAAINPELLDDPQLSGVLSGIAGFRFPTGKLSKLSGGAELQAYKLQKKNYLLELEQPVRVEIANGNYSFDSLHLKGDDTDLKIKGRVQNGQIDYRASGFLNLKLAELAVPEIAQVKGRVNLEARLVGEAEDPGLRGTFNAQEIDLRLKAFEQPFEGLKFSGTLYDNKIHVQNIEARYANGTVYGGGTVLFADSSFPTLKFKLNLDNPKVKVYPVAYARANGTLNLEGSELPYKVSGSLKIAEALITESFSPDERAKALKSSKFLPQKVASGSGSIQVFELDILLKADGNIFVRNSLFDAEVKGNLRVLNGIKTPRLLGDVAVVHGKLLFKDNFFTIQSGSMRFDNPAVINPSFDLTGQTEMKGYKIILVASGKASDPKITFESHPQLSQQDIVSLLTLGITSSDFQNLSRQNRSAYTRDELYGLLFSQSGINKDLQNKLGVKVSVDQSQLPTPESAFRPRSADATETISPKVVLQKQVTKKLNASVGSTVGVGGNQEKNVGLEYNLSRKWSVLGVYEDQRGNQPNNSRTSVGADIKFKLRFK